MKLLLKIIRYIYRPIKLYFLNKKVTEGRGKIFLSDPFFKIKISLGANARLILNGDLTFLTHLEGNLLSHIFWKLSSNSKTFGPVVKKSDFSTSTTLLMSSSFID